MGCDIHLYIEYSRKETREDGKKYWTNFGNCFGHRDYHLFGILARDVRIDNPNGFPVKGLPGGGLGFVTENDSLIYISEDGEGDNETTLERAQAWNRDFHCKIINNRAGEPQLVENPDWHSHSWLTLQEYEKALNIYWTDPETFNIHPEYKAILGAMKSLDEQGYDVRAVFWFDN